MSTPVKPNEVSDKPRKGFDNEVEPPLFVVQP